MISDSCRSFLSDPRKMNISNNNFDCQCSVNFKLLHDLAPHQFAFLQVAALGSDREISCTVASVDVGLVRLKAAK
jgi:hypothetical protein